MIEKDHLGDRSFDNLCGSHLQSQVTLKMASAQVVETSVNNNSPSQDSYHPDDLFQSRNNVLITIIIKKYFHKYNKNFTKNQSANTEIIKNTVPIIIKTG